MLQKELAKRLKARYDTKMDGSGWMEVSSDGIPLCRIKYNGQFLSNADQNLSDEYSSKIADIQDEISAVREYVGLYEHAPQMKAADVSDYRQLAAFGDTVLAATYSEKNRFMFCTWKQNADGNSVFWGDYSPNYEYVRLCMSEKMVVRIFIWTEYITRFEQMSSMCFPRRFAVADAVWNGNTKKDYKKFAEDAEFYCNILKNKGYNPAPRCDWYPDLFKCLLSTLKFAYNLMTKEMLKGLIFKNKDH